MINIVAFTVAAAIWLILWGIGARALDAALIPVAILISAAAAYTYIPLVKKTVRNDDE